MMVGFGYEDEAVLSSKALQPNAEAGQKQNSDEDVKVSLRECDLGIGRFS